SHLHLQAGIDGVGGEARAELYAVVHKEVEHAVLRAGETDAHQPTRPLSGSRRALVTAKGVVGVWTKACVTVASSSRNSCCQPAAAPASAARTARLRSWSRACRPAS